MGNILLRIQEIARKEGVTIGALERNIGASKGVLSRAISNGTDIQSKWLGIIVENYPQYSTRWLLTGEGSMLRSDQSQSLSSQNIEVMSTSKALLGEDPFIYKMYKEKDEENRTLIRENGCLEERIRTLEAKLQEHNPITDPPKVLDPAKGVSIKKPSSRHGSNVGSLGVPSGDI